MIGFGETDARCSATGCRATPAYRVNWRNPRIHSAERVKVWLACDEHRDQLEAYLVDPRLPRGGDPDRRAARTHSGVGMSQSAPSGIRRWGAYLALTIVFAVVCGLLSWWQWSRRAETVAEIDTVSANYDQTPVPVDELLPTLDAWDEAVEWRPVALHGTYLVDEQLLVRNRPRDGAPGFEVLTPLLLDDGTVFVVNRGWLPTGQCAGRAG